MLLVLITSMWLQTTQLQVQTARASKDRDGLTAKLEAVSDHHKYRFVVDGRPSSHV